MHLFIYRVYSIKKKFPRNLWLIKPTRDMILLITIIKDLDNFSKKRCRIFQENENLESLKISLESSMTFKIPFSRD